MAGKKRDWKFGIIATIAFVLIFLLYCSTINPEFSDLSGDSARFMLLAKSLAQGSGYREIEKPNAPPHAEYMPGLPLILAAIYHFDSNSLRPMKFLMAVFAFCSAIFFYLFLFREHRVARYVLAICFGLTPFLIFSQTQILSDLPHLALLLLAFFCFEKSRGKNEIKSREWIIAGLSTAMAFYFRQIAVIAFASGILLILALKDLRRLKIFLSYTLGFMVPASVWYVRNFLISGSMEPSYGRKIWQAQASNPFAGTLTLGGLIARIFRRIWFFDLHLEKDLLLGPYGHGLFAAWIILLAFLLIGFFYELFKQKNIAAVFYVPYLAAISSWEGWVPRYLLPVLPLSLFFIFRGLELVFKAVFRKKLFGQWLAAQIIFLWLVLNLLRTITAISFQHTPLLYPPEQLAFQEREAVSLIGAKNFAYYPDAFEWKKKGSEYLLAKEASYYHFFAMAEWTRKNLQPGEVVVCRKPTLFAWQSRGRSVQYPAELDVDKFLTETEKRGGNHLLIEEISPELRPLLFQFWQSRPERFKLEKQIGETYLFKLE